MFKNIDFYRPISQTVFLLSIAINRAEHVCATVISKHNYLLMCNHKIVINIIRGVARIWEGGLFFQTWEFACRERHAAHGFAMRIVRGVRGHASPRNFFRVYFDQILSLLFFKNYHFLCKK